MDMERELPIGFFVSAVYGIGHNVTRNFFYNPRLFLPDYPVLVLDLFSGIGGFSLGLERAGMQTLAFCEIEPFCQKILKKHWPHVPIFEDIRKLKADDLPAKPDLICGGYPCQPFSQAGKRAGEEDDRHLWPQMFRLIQECRPRWVICENVYGHVSMGLDSVLSDLESENYTPQSFIVPACAVNAPHRRNRVWIIANQDSRKLWNPEEQTREQGQTVTRTNGFQGVMGNPEYYANVGNSTGKRTQRSWITGKQEPSALLEKGLFDGTGTGGRSRNWATEPAVGRVANGIPDRVDRLKGLGNAVVPQIPEAIGRCILDAERQYRK